MTSKGEPEKSIDSVTDYSMKETTGQLSVPAKVARFTARSPAKCLVGALVFSTVLSAIGLIVGNFSITVDNKGWRSRGTLIAKREIQIDVLMRFRDKLFADTDGSVWDDLQNNVVMGFIDLEDREDETNADSTRQLASSYDNGNENFPGQFDWRTNKPQAPLRNNLYPENYGSVHRNLLFDDGCNVDLYSRRKLLAKDNLFAVYKTELNADSSPKSILDSDVLFEICRAETATNKVLEDNGACGGCSNNKCLPPHSLLLVIRQELGDLSLTCDQLQGLYTPSFQANFTNSLVECVEEILTNYDPATQSYGDTTKCPAGFEPNLVDFDFAKNGNTLLRHSTSFYITSKKKDKDVYALRDQYVRTDDAVVNSVYDTVNESQNELYVDSILLMDMSLAMASLMITFTCMGIHTKSFWLTFVGVLQIFYAIPLSYFVYYFVAGITFFPFLNFIGVFVAAALGADDVFVAVDKWKNARIENPTATTEDVAAIALPDAASAMLLTTSTTTVAFFATLICPVTPILCFALFCGLLISFNYIMNVLLVFPALCLYDIWIMNGSRNFLITCGCCAKNEDTAEVGDEEEKEETENEEKQSLIHRIFAVYFQLLRKFRYVIILIMAVAGGICVYFASTIKLPDSVDVRLLPEDNEYELHYSWRQNMLSGILFGQSSNAQINWGLVAADTGNRNDPDSISTLELDEDFDLSGQDAQEYLLSFCSRLFAEEFANPPSVGYECPMNRFDSWLQAQAVSATPDSAYTTSCDGATSVPMAEEKFDECIIAWSQANEGDEILQNQGKVKILQLESRMSVSWTSPFDVMNAEWNKFEDWLGNERSNAPAGVNKMFHTSAAFWWYDTNASMLGTAVGAALIALGFSAAVVLFSSRSFLLTLFSGLCVLYVLVATTASLVGFGWELGFLESVCFAILIGISCDFVIHFGHAYIHQGGSLPKEERTKHALFHMGPSILAAAATTFSAALVMLFCRVTFFTKFALILLMTILHATVGSFVVYLVFAVTFGPAEPTKTVDNIVLRCRQALCKTEKKENADSPPA